MTKIVTIKTGEHSQARGELIAENDEWVTLYGEEIAGTLILSLDDEGDTDTHKVTIPKYWLEEI